MYIFRAHYSKESTTEVAFAVLVLLQYLASLYVEIHYGASFQAEPSGEISKWVYIHREYTKRTDKSKQQEEKKTYTILFLIACTEVLS